MKKPSIKLTISVFTLTVVATASFVLGMSTNPGPAEARLISEYEDTIETIFDVVEFKPNFETESFFEVFRFKDKIKGDSFFNILSFASGGSFDSYFDRACSQQIIPDSFYDVFIKHERSNTESFVATYCDPEEGSTFTANMFFREFRFRNYLKGEEIFNVFKFNFDFDAADFFDVFTLKRSYQTEDFFKIFQMNRNFKPEQIFDAFKLNQEYSNESFFDVFSLNNDYSIESFFDLFMTKRDLDRLLEVPRRR
ncbi:hypothetical protein ACFL10_00110 [Patescibacteria group bacterium]